MQKAPRIDAIVPFIARESSHDWVRDQWILRDTLRSLLALDESYLSVTLVGHDFPEFTRNLKRIRHVGVDFNPPNIDDRTAKLADSAFKYMYGLRDAFERKVPWVFFMNADDFVSNRLPQLADLDNHDAVIISNGFSWESGSSWLMRLGQFNRRCGSCNLIRCKESFFPVWLGGKSEGFLADANHNEVLDKMTAAGHRIQLPRQRLAVYRLGNHNIYWRKPTLKGFSSVIRAATRFLLRASPLTTRAVREFSIPKGFQAPNSPPEFL